MAEAMISRSWPDGDVLTVSIEADESFPDAISEVEATCARLYANALGVTLAQPVEDVE